MKSKIIQDPYYKDDKLHWYDCDLSEAADQFGTPLHIICAEAIRDSFQSFKTPFERAGLPFKMYYSVKTNPVPLFLHKLHTLGTGFETVSGWEYRLLQQMSISEQEIIHTGLTDFFSPNCKMITIATPNHLEKLINLNPSDNRPISFGITINPKLLRGLWDITLNTSRKGSPLGFHPSSEQFDEIIETVSNHPELKLTGLHMHLGSGIHSVKPFLKSIDVLTKAALKLKEHNIHISLLDIGGGFALPTAPMMKIRTMVTSLLGIHKSKNSAELTSYLENIAQKLKKCLHTLINEGIKIKEIAAEPGRLVSGPCQITVLSIQDIIKKGTNNYAVCDAGAMSLSPMLLTEKHRILSLLRKTGPEIEYEVLGKLPSAMDRISAVTKLTELQVGAQLVVLDTGAYFTSMNNTFNGPRPPIVWIENGQMELARYPESETDLLNHYLFPSSNHLNQS